MDPRNRPPQKIKRLSRSYDTWVNPAQSALSAGFTRLARKILCGSSRSRDSRLCAQAAWFL